MKADGEHRTVRSHQFSQATANSVADHGLADLFRDCEAKTLTFCSIPSDEEKELVAIEATPPPLYP